MRYELRLILWVTAVGLVLSSVWHGFWPSSDLSLGQRNTADLSISGNEERTVEGRSETSWRLIDDLNEVDTSRRPMFSVMAPLTAEIITGSVQQQPVVLPILKGIVDREGVRSAVFAGAADPSLYSVVAVGGQYQGYMLVEIQSEQVVTKSSEGDVIIFKLRGPGELP